MKDIIITQGNLEIWFDQSNPDNGYSLSDEGGWVDGIYDSKESAVTAYNKLDWSQLNDLMKKVNQAEKRLITPDDIKTYYPGTTLATR